MSPASVPLRVAARIATVATLGAAGIAFLGAMALVGHQRTETHRLVNIETYAMMEARAR